MINDNILIQHCRSDGDFKPIFDSYKLTDNLIFNFFNNRKTHT